MNAVELSVVIPCYNEQDVLEELRTRLIPVLENVKATFEIILVDDGSSDKTRKIIEMFHRNDPRFVVVILSRNHGHQLALSAGLSVSRGKRILVLDADLQDPPELLPKMMRKMDQGFDVVYGKRRLRKGETVFKVTTAAAFYRLLSSINDVDIPLDSGDFRLISRRVLNHLLEMPEQHRFIRGMISWIGFPQAAIEYDRDERFAGETKYPLRRMIRFAMDGITSFSVFPLKIAVWLGLIVAAFSILLILYVLFSWFNGQTIQGWASNASLVLLLGGVQLFVTGILGEYVGRIYMQSKHRPLFVIEQIMRAEQCVKDADRSHGDILIGDEYGNR